MITSRLLVLVACPWWLVPVVSLTVPSTISTKTRRGTVQLSFSSYLESLSFHDDSNNNYNEEEENNLEVPPEEWYAESSPMAGWEGYKHPQWGGYLDQLSHHTQSNTNSYASTSTTTSYLDNLNGYDTKNLPNYHHMNHNGHENHNTNHHPINGGSSPPVNHHNQEVQVVQTISSGEQSAATETEAEEEMEQEQLDKYLQMVSSEVNVKKLNGENYYALTDIPFDVMRDRFLDNVEDSMFHSKYKYTPTSDDEPDKRPTIVVLGTGWAAHAFVKSIQSSEYRVVVVSPVNHFVFTPMLASAAVGTVEYRSMTEPIRVTNSNIDNFVEGRAIDIDPSAKTIQVQVSPLSTLTNTFTGVASQQKREEEFPSDLVNNVNSAAQLIELHYDYLLCAVGTAVRSDMVKGAKEYCFNLKTSQDSKRLRTAIGEALEYASRPEVSSSYYIGDPYLQQLAKEERRRRVHFVIVGGGPTGVEMAGELSDFVSQITTSTGFPHLKDDIQITLVHGGNTLLPAMDAPLRKLALTSLQLQGVNVRLNTRLTQVGQDFISLREKPSMDNPNPIEETIPVGLTVWAAGNAPVPFVQKLLNKLPPEAAGTNGHINVDAWLRCPTHDNFGSIFVLGDCASFYQSSKYNTDPTNVPQTAQVAGQQGTYMARMLNRHYDTSTTPPQLPDNNNTNAAESEALSTWLRIWLLARYNKGECPEFTFLSLGLLAYIGNGEALNQVELGTVPIFNYAGKVAFALWRSVYLSKQAATRNQALIAFDWLRTELFGRDITRL